MNTDHYYNPRNPNKSCQYPRGNEQSPALPSVERKFPVSKYHQTCRKSREASDPRCQVECGGSTATVWGPPGGCGAGAAGDARSAHFGPPFCRRASLLTSVPYFWPSGSPRTGRPCTSTSVPAHTRVPPPAPPPPHPGARLSFPAN